MLDVEFLGLPVVPWQPAAEAHGLDFRERGSQPFENSHEPAEVVAKLRLPRAAADMGVQHHDRKDGFLRGEAHLADVFPPDSVFRTRAAGVARVHVAVAEADVTRSAIGPR